MRYPYLLGVAAALLVACDGPLIPERPGIADDAYNFALPPPYAPLVYRWPTGHTIRVFIAAGADPARLTILRDSVFLPAATAWESAVLYREFSFALSERVEDADVVLAWSDAELPIDVTGCPPPTGAVAVTVFCPGEEPGRLLPFPMKPPDTATSRVRMLVVIRGVEVSNPPSARNFGAHELGHVLGIGRHSSNREDVMFGYPTTYRPTRADRATIRLLYHTTPDLIP